MTNSNDRLDSIDQRLEIITGAVQANQQQIATAFEAIDRLANVQLQLAQIVDSERSKTNAAIDSINAALERQDRILDYLLRGDRNGNGEIPGQ